LVVKEERANNAILTFWLPNITVQSIMNRNSVQNVFVELEGSFVLLEFLYCVHIPHFSSAFFLELQFGNGSRGMR